MLSPDFSEAERFLDMLDPATGKFTFQTILEQENDKDKSSTLTNVLHGSFEDLKIKLGAINNCGAGIFVMVNEGDGLCHGGAKTCRTVASVKRVRALFVDLDGAPLEPALKFKVTPSMVVQTSQNRYHAYWLTDNCPLEQFKTHQQALLSQLNGDPAVCDLPRVMRLPGFYHMKREPYLVKLIAPSAKGCV